MVQRITSYRPQAPVPWRFQPRCRGRAGGGL